MTTSRTPLLVAHGIRKRYRRRVALHGASLEVHAGEAVALTGENGSGKTTLLRICAGLLSPDSGTVHRHGRVGYCPQEPGVFDHLTIGEHLELFGGTGEGTRLLRELGLPPDYRTVARELSGGSRQKLNLVLAVLGAPQVLLLDEPYQGFDRGTYVDFWRHVRDWRDEGRAVLVVTHALTDLDRVDRVVELTPVSQPADAAVGAR
jgi:ABC-2 type transport system ATP-binding protein